MDAVRFGRSVRALRQRRGWRQEDLARAANVSRATIYRVERGQADRVTVAVLRRICAALTARLVVRLDWNAEELDRLLDGDHAGVINGFATFLHADGWVFATEVTFNQHGERGSIDILAHHAASGAVLVVEVKTVVPDVGPMLATLDRKARLASGLARERGWRCRHVSRLLLIREGPTPRRHVSRLRQIFDAAFPTRGVAVKRWLHNPAEAMAGLMFFSSAHHTSGIKRVRVRRGGVTHERKAVSSQRSRR